MFAVRIALARTALRPLAALRPVPRVLPATTTSAIPPMASVAAQSIGQVREYRVKNALQLRCKHCLFVVRGGKLRVVCKENPRHKQRQK